jgi:hypothetical protein
MAESTAVTAPLLTSRFHRAFAVAYEAHAVQLRKGTRIPYPSAVGGGTGQPVPETSPGTAYRTHSARPSFDGPVGPVS